jgi:hypothetical protein
MRQSQKTVRKVAKTVLDAWNTDLQRKKFLIHNTQEEICLTLR